MASQLSGIAIILFIAFGSLTFILLFIFSKRQITRFALKSKHGPHVEIAVDAPKQLRLEIERRLDRISKIRYEPWLLNEYAKEQFVDEDLVSQLTPPHLYRMKVVDDVKELSNLIRAKDFSLARRFHENTMQYLLRLHKDGAISSIDTQSLYKFLTLYEDARHQPVDFGYPEYCEFKNLLILVKNDILEINDPHVPEEETVFQKVVGEFQGKGEAPPDECVSPLSTRSEPVSKSCLSVRTFAHETAV